MRSLGIKQKDHPMDYIIAIDKNNTLGGVSPSFSHLDSTNPLIVLNTTITLYTEYFSLRLIATKFKIFNFPTSYRRRLSWEVERDARDSDEKKRKMLTDLNQCDDEEDEAIVSLEGSACNTPHTRPPFACLPQL